MRQLAGVLISTDNDTLANPNPNPNPNPNFNFNPPNPNLTGVSHNISRLSRCNSLPENVVTVNRLGLS